MPLKTCETSSTLQKEVKALLKQVDIANIEYKIK